jgi:hypothetical protein
MLSSRTTALLVLLIFYGGALQYFPTAIGQAQANIITLTQSDLSDLSDAGPMKYAKDLAISMVTIYFVWRLLTGARLIGSRIYIVATTMQITFMVIGAIGVVNSADVKVFVTAGARWNLAFNGSIALLCLCFTAQQDGASERWIGRGLLILSVVNSLLVFYQTRIAGNVYDLVSGQGAARLTGLFSHAGVAGTFAIGIALVCVSLKKLDLATRIGLYANAMFASLAAGSRQAIIIVIALAAFEIYNRLKGAGASRKGIVLPALFVAATMLATPAIYAFVNDAAGRGDVFETQVAEGGRFASLGVAADDLMSSDVINVFFGAGIGKATNNATTLLALSGGSSSSYILNYITDNTAVTLVFQYGVIGATCFFAVFIWSMRLLSPRLESGARRLHWLFFVITLFMCFACNIFEQYFFIAGIAAAIGLNLAPRVKSA